MATYTVESDDDDDEQSRRQRLLVGDILVTLAVAALAVLDLVLGILSLANPVRALVVFAGVNETSITAHDVRVQAVSSWRTLETSALNFLLCGLRLYAYCSRKPFSGLLFVVTLAVSAVGTTATFLHNEIALGFVGFGTGTVSTERVLLLVRGALTLVATLAALEVYEFTAVLRGNRRRSIQPVEAL